MLISLLGLGDACEINLHAEQVYNNLRITKRNLRILPNNDMDEIEFEILNSEKGIFSSILTFSTLSSIFEFTKEALSYSVVIIDFSRLHKCQKNSHIRFKEIIKNLDEKTLVFKNINRQVVENLAINKLVTEEKDFYDKIVIGNTDIDLNDLCSRDFFNFSFERSLIQLYKKEESFFEYHYSSSVYLNRFIDIKRMLDSNDHFLLYCLYKLALKILNNRIGWVINEQERNYTLFCQTLNGSYITSILSELLLLDITFIDHLGPLNKIYGSLNSEIVIKEKNYIVISDVVCLGTEVKIAKNLIEYSGGKYCGNISFINVKVVKEEEGIDLDIEFLYEISKSNNIIDYSIRTALDL